MVKASALYIVIIIALAMALLCSSLITVAYFYRSAYQKKFRYDRLTENLYSGVDVLLGTGPDTALQTEKTCDLFNDSEDSVKLRRFFWGVYDVGVSKAFKLQDTLYKAFTIANSVDSSKWGAIYLPDEDNPISVSGKTLIRGQAFLPKAGIIQAFVDGKSYQGDKRLVLGSTHLSAKLLPALNQARINQFKAFRNQKHPGDTFFIKDTIKSSFLLKTYFINLGSKPAVINKRYLEGNVVILSDTSVTIDSSYLQDVIIFAKSIRVMHGFSGHCQLFATDSIHIDARCQFAYPSCLGIINYGAHPGKNASSIRIDSNAVFNGVMFTYVENKDALPPLISVGRNVSLTGQLYSQGTLKYSGEATLNGCTFAASVAYFKGFTYYANYLIDITLDSKTLSSYYLTSDLLPTAAEKRKVLQWLEEK